MPGRIDRVAGNEGDAFKLGQELVKINDDDLLAKQRHIHAQMANAQAALQNAQVQYSRELYSPRSESPSSMPGFGMPILMDNMFTRPMGDMFGYGDRSLERHADLSSARNVINQAQGALIQSQSQLQELATKIRDSGPLAPFDGVILKKMVEVGDTVQPGQALVSYGHIAYLRIRSDVPARLARGLTVKQLIPITLANGHKTHARVAQIYPMADATNHTITVKFDLPEGTGASPGMYVELIVPDTSGGSAVSLVSIPSSALIAGRSLPQVLVVTDEGSTSTRLLRLGRRIDEHNVLVLSGLQPGQRIINNPPSNVRSGWMPQAQVSH
jgi:multidrug efflux pump subunit AcrA (membrane-fusion protein)